MHAIKKITAMWINYLKQEQQKNNNNKSREINVVYKKC